MRNNLKMKAIILPSLSGLGRRKKGSAIAMLKVKKKGGNRKEGWWEGRGGAPGGDPLKWKERDLAGTWTERGPRGSPFCHPISKLTDFCA